MRFDKYKLHDKCHGVSFTNYSLIIFLSDVLDQEWESQTEIIILWLLGD